MIRWLAAALLDWGVIAGCLLAIARFPLCTPIAIFVIGTRQHALGILGHDGAHSAITRVRWLNDALAQLCWWPIGLGLDGYRVFHLRHHRWLGTELDPEIGHKAKFPRAYAVPVTGGHVARLFVLDLIGVTSLRESAALFWLVWSNASARDALGVMALWSFGGALLFRLHLWWVIAVWIAGIGTSGWAVARLRTWREHIGTDGTLEMPVRWWGNLLHTPHGIGYHAEHHRFAWRPFYVLGKRSGR